jgi:hypothetical protein
VRAGGYNHPYTGGHPPATAPGAGAGPPRHDPD